MLMKFPQNQIVQDRKIEELKKTLSYTLLFNKRTLKNCKIQLHKLQRSQGEGDSPYKYITLQLQNRYERLRVRRNVIQIAEKAEELANQSPHTPLAETEKGCKVVRRRITNLFDNTRPTLTDVRFLRFAQHCLKKAENQESLLGMGKKKRNVMAFEELKREKGLRISQENYELAEFLLELAHLLRSGKQAEFTSRVASDCSKSVAQEIEYHVENCGGSLQASLEESKNQLAVIKGLIGYAQILTDYYVTLSPYPSTREVTKHFKDLDYVNMASN